MDTLPTCAQLRQSGTVIIKLKDYCHRICTSGRTNYVSSPDKCELCVRTRTNSQYSDCDSDKVKKCRPHRSSTARSRYVNVCAAVCLLLLAGDLSPQSLAAPRPRRGNMEIGQELSFILENPCNYVPGSTSKAKEFTKEIAEKVASISNIALRLAGDIIEPKFANIIYNYKDVPTPWLRNFVSASVFPEEKKSVDTKMSPEHLSRITANLKEQTGPVNEHLRDMYFALKMVTAGLYVVHKEALQATVYKDEQELGDPFKKYFDAVLHVLCEFSEGVSPENNVQLTEKPSLPNRLDTSFLIYRDSILYLDYLREVMEHYAKTA